MNPHFDTSRSSWTATAGGPRLEVSPASPAITRERRRCGGSSPTAGKPGLQLSDSLRLLDRELGPSVHRGQRPDGPPGGVSRRTGGPAHQARHRACRPSAISDGCRTAPRSLLERVDRDRPAASGGMRLTLALSYSGHDEIVRTARRLASRVAEGELDPDAIDDELFGDNLDTRDTPPADLVIRTGSERRLSNFLLWQAAYAELYFTDRRVAGFLTRRLRPRRGLVPRKEDGPSGWWRRRGDGFNAEPSHENPDSAIGVRSSIADTFRRGCCAA